MHEQGIRSLLQTEPYKSQTDSQVATTLNATSSVVAPGSKLITSRTLYADLGPAAAETILQKLEAAGAANPVVKRVLGWLLPSEAGVDITHSSTRDQIDALVSASVLSLSEGAALKGLGEVSRSYGESLGLLGHGESISANEIAALR